MRRAPLAGLLVVLFASHARADTVPYKAVVTDAEVKLRAGPSDQFPDTGTIPRGTEVVVEKEEGNGWLAVTAPHGSISWVATQFIQDLDPDRATPKNVFVETEGEVTVAAGKVGLAQPLDIRRVKIPSGTTFVVIGPKATFAGKTWYPITPPAGDVRYLPKTAVKFDRPANNNFVVRVNESVTPVPPGGSPSAPPATPAGGALATIPGPGTITPATGGVTAGKPAVNHPLWAQAETAERENRLADAEKAYFDLAAVMNAQGGDHDIASLCYTRIHMLREKKRNAGGANAPPPNVLRPPAKEDRGVRPGTPVSLPPAAPPDRATDDRAQLSGTGVLRRSAMTPDGPNRALYALETSPGVVKMYVTAGQGVELERYLGKRVDVYGTASTRTGLSKPYLVATSVEAAP